MEVIRRRGKRESLVRKVVDKRKVGKRGQEKVFRED